MEIKLAFVSAPGCCERARCWWRGPCEVGEIRQGRDDDAVGELSEEDTNAQAVSRDAIGVGSLDSFDEALESQAPQVVRGLGRGVFLPPVRSHLGAQGLVGEPADDVGESGHGAEQRHGARIAEAQTRSSLAVVDTREYERLEGGRVGEAGAALTEGGQEAVIGGRPGAP